MSDKQKTIDALSLLIQTCKDALASIAAANGIVPDDLSDLKDSEFAVIQKDFISLLAFLYSATTKTALSLKPSSPTFSASLTPLKDLTNDVSRLANNVRLIRKAHGEAILKETQAAAESVVSPIQNLAQTLLSDLEASVTDGEQYLARVGEVHHAIEKVRGADGLSSNNVAAVRKVWSANQASLEDALRELQEMAEEEGEDEDEFDDGWDELGIEASPKLTAEELANLKKLEAILKLCNLLHKTTMKKVFSPAVQKLEIQQEINPIVDELANDSAALPAAVDDLISTVYSPQDSVDMSERVLYLEGVVLQIRTRLETLFALPPVGELMKEPVNPGKKGSDIKTWFETCFGQIKKLSSEMSKALQGVQ